MTTRRHFLKGLAAGAVTMAARDAWSAADAPDKPNIILILCDDVGYGDAGCYGATCVKTPNIDRLAREGVRFTDAHSPSAVCTPTRYSVLTGQYAWRNPLGDHILSGVAPLSIAPGTPTVPAVLKDAGYATGLVGKWHLGLGTQQQPVDYNTDIAPGPLEVGFDYAFYYPATNDRVPCVYIEGRRVVNLDPADPIRVSYKDKVGDDPTGADHPERLKMKADNSHSQTIVNGISRIGYMAGGNSARWVDEDMADVFAAKAVYFIENHKDGPFFLYFTPHDIHEPMAPHPRFRGTSTCGTRGDAIHELDWVVGQVLSALDRLNLADNTLLVFTSDNGGAIKDTYDDGTNAQHARQAPNGPLRGDKGSLHEGGHRVPCIARWPKRIAAGRESSALIGLHDMLPTFATAAGIQPPKAAGPDSVDMLPVLLGDTGAKGRDYLVHHVNGKSALAIRQGDWKLITANWDNNGPPLLYNLASDLGETKNLAKKDPEKVKELAALLEAERKRGG